jgi:hypothetical protein
MREILDHFILPIETLHEKHTIYDNLYDDLELLECRSKDKNSSFYSKLFNPTSKAGKIVMEKMAKFYTSDTQFLKDSQKLYKKCHTLKNNTKLCQSAWDVWSTTKKDSNFHEKYQYLNIDQIKWLNSSAPFLLILTFYSILSPLLNIIAPFLLLLVPFIILKIMKVPITAASYTKILLEQLDKHSFGQLFTRFWEVPPSQRVYLAMCFGMYVYNIYQNVLSCYQFYKNTHFINTYFKKMNNYVKHTKEQLNTFISLLSPYKSFHTYKKYLGKKFTDLDILYKTLNNIPKARFNPIYLNSMGFVMKQFYLMNNSKPINDLLNFSFAFNGYIDNIEGLSDKIQKKLIRPAKIINCDKNIVQFKDTFYPLIEGKIIKNDIDISNNVIITGPNAAGKTTLLKTTLLNILITQQFGFGFYRKAKLSPFHFIHCYLNIPDTSSRDSLFQAEARRCGKILQLIETHPEKRHFCIFDELYSGTNPFEAIASAYSYLNYLKHKPQVSFMLTTHFIRLCNLFLNKKQIKNYNMETTIHKNIPTYSYKLVPGISKIKGGICVLRNLGYPEAILKETEEMIHKI